MRSSRVPAIAADGNPARSPRLDPRVKIGWTVGVTNASADSIDAPNDERQHTEHGLERKQQLLDAAAELFADRGYAATRIADICTAAGVAKGLFYWYFPTKGALFAELVRTMRLRLRRAQGAVLDPDADAVTRIANGAEASVRFMADHAAYFALLDVERTDPDVADVLDEGAGVYLDDVRRLVEEGQRAGDIADAPSSLVAVGVLGAVSSFSNSYRNGRLGDDITVDDLAAFVRRWVASALT
jgi:AcrR family transcriptional regulator